MSEITVYKRSIESGQQPATEEEVEAAKAAAATGKRVAGDGSGASGNPYVSSQDRAAAIKGAAGGSSGGETTGGSGEAAAAKSQNDSDRKAATVMVRKRHNEKQRQKTFANPDPFDPRKYSKEIRETADTLRRLKVLRGKESPRSPQERFLASLEGDERKRAVAMQKSQLPDVDMSTDGGAAAAIKRHGDDGGSDGVEWSCSPRASPFKTGGE
jgi:hypothetical protein